VPKAGRLRGTLPDHDWKHNGGLLLSQSRIEQKRGRHSYADLFPVSVAGVQKHIGDCSSARPLAARAVEGGSCVPHAYKSIDHQLYTP
jgi:hypothetical protein